MAHWKLSGGIEPETRSPNDLSRDTSFYYSFLVLPPAKRDAIVAVWDFCRAVDDAVDEPQGAEPQQALERWRAEIDRCFGAYPLTPQGRNLQPFIGQFQLPRRPFEDLVDGVEMDLRVTRYETFEALYEYCWRVASTVGLICLEIFGYTRAESREYAVSLGIALQLTNIIRDVRVDLERGRVYLPQEDMGRFGVTEADLRAGRVTEGVRGLLAHECGRAREYYRRAQQSLPRDDRRSLVAAEIMRGIYQSVLGRIERAGYDVFGEVIRVPRSRRAVIAASIWARSLAGLRAGT
jgi:15-cis-phytoene synthase